MINKNYYNNKLNQLYVLHFPGNFNTSTKVYDIIKNEESRVINISKDISIITINTQDYVEKSPLIKQLKNNAIPYYNGAESETSWNNTKKIRYILENLKKIKTKYVLISDGADVVIVNNLNETFINAYLTYNKKIIFNATAVRFPDIPLENLREVLSYNSNFPYLNAGVCFGETESLISFYEKAYEINEATPLNDSEQLIIRKTKLLMPNLVGIDYKVIMFRACHSYDTKIINNENGDVIFETR